MRHRGCVFTLAAIALVVAHASAQQPSCADADRHLTAGRSYHAQREYKAAIAEFRQASRLCPSNHQPLLEMVQSELAAAEPKQAEKHVREYLKLEPTSDLGHFFLAFSLYQQRNYPDSARASVETVRLAPRDPKGYVLLGMSEYFLNNFAQAERALNDGLKLQPDNLEATYFLGLSQMGREHFALAAKTFQQLTEKNPDSYLAYDKLGVCYQRQGKPDAALAAFFKSEKLAPKSDAASDAPFADHAMMLIDAQQPNDAVPLAQEAVRRNPGNPMNHFFLGRALLEAGRTQEAEGPLQQVITLSPDYREAHYLLGKVEQKLGKRDAAAREFATVRALDAKAAESASKQKGPH